ncbi:hypothetical protein Ahy_A10g049474 [Arachis hypogaea]|uniref:Uncharacterized protein n=1 Tax=Arachis hypogaea TaxID=3818 RepID=A0A445B778_ARAHY|nr:hypothetical protein Ahy_A10g049474 [Arachis hypogaea]
MVTIMNPMTADHATKFDCLARQVERIAQIVDYDEGKRQNTRGNYEDFENLCQNENDALKGRENPQSRCYVSLPESEVVKVAIVGLEFYMRRKLLNVHVPNLAERVRQVEILKKEKEKYQIFDVLLRDKQLVLPEGRILLSVKDLKGNLIAIMKCQLKFDDAKKEMKVDSDPFDSRASFAEPDFGVNMVGMPYDFDMTLGDFKSNVQSV